jgi:hypothetical protein
MCYGRMESTADGLSRETSPAMSQPHLTFACELDPERLTELFADGSVIGNLQALQARVIIMVSDLSDERAAVIKQLNQAGIPLVGVPLFPAEEGYYFTVENAPRAAARYQEWKAWSAQEQLRWDWVGLDIEPEARFYEQIMANPWRLPAMLLPRLRDHQAPSRAREAYAALVERIHQDGWQVENYQFPLIADERKTGSTLVQRLLGLVDVPTDREVWMLYNSFLRTLGPGILWSYGPEAEAIAVGTTGGGPDIPGHPQMPALGWEEFARDLRLARRWTDQIYVHSLEGCVWQGFLERLRGFDWSVTGPPSTTRAAAGIRRLLQAGLWCSAHPREAGLIAVGAAVLLRIAPKAAR